MHMTQGRDEAMADTHGLAAAVAGFLDWLKARNLSRATIDGRLDAIRRFLGYLSEHGLTRFQDVSVQTLAEYRQWMTEVKRYKDATIETRLSAVRSLFDHLEERSLLFENPARQIVLHRHPARLPQVVGVPEIRRLLAVPDCTRPDGLRNRAILEVFYATGMRLGELTGLSVFDIDVENQTVRVLGKGRKERVLPLGSLAAFHVRQYLAQARPKLLGGANPDLASLWLGRRSRALGAAAISQMVGECRVKAGIHQAVSPHTLRRSCATHLLANDAHPLMVSELLGHSRVGTLTRYLRVTAGDLRAMHSQSRLGK